MPFPNNPVPLVNQPLVPAGALPGGPAFTLTVNGTGFVSGSTVHWNGSARPTTFVSGSRVTAAITASDIATRGTALVTVVSPAPGGGASNVVFFPVTLPTSAVAFQSSVLSADPKDYNLAVGDFNGDGKLDLAVVNFYPVSTGTVSIYLGNGDGTFQSPVDYPAGDGPVFVTTGDFNGDGKLDLVVGNANGNNYISVLLGHGDGTFQAPITTDVSGGAEFIAVGDFNGDGKLDLALGQDPAGLAILLGNGDGTFQAPVYYSFSSADSIAVGDFNRDGKLDLAVGNANDQAVSILLGNGDGTFQSPVNYPTCSSVPPTTEFVTTADFNGDGKLDLALAVTCTAGASQNYANYGAISVLLGNGDGTFQNHVEYETVPESVGGFSSSSYVTVGDLNGDGKLDLAAASLVTSGSEVSILLGNGDGTFQGSVNYPLSVLNAFYLGLGDFNGDGKLDLAALGSDDGAVAILLQIPTPGVTLSSSSANFGNQTVGAAASPQTITLKNTGTASLTLSSITITGADSGDFALAGASTCPASGGTLAVGASCNIVATFTPTIWGSRSGTLSIADNAPNSPQTISLSGTGQDFDMSGANSATITPGSTASYTITISPEGGFNYTVTLACSGAPSYSACSPSPSSVTLNGSNSTIVAVTVTTTAPTMSPNSPRNMPTGIGLSGWVSWCWLLLFLMLAVLARRRDRRVRLVLAASLFLAVLWASCGGGATRTPGTPVGNYTLTVTATMTSSSSSAPLTHTFSLTLNIT